MKQENKRKKYATEAERKSARTIQNRINKRTQRANEKLRKPKESSFVSLPPALPIPPATTYADDMFNWWSLYKFSHSITLTNNKLVTLNMSNHAIEKLIVSWVELGYITNYVKVNEISGGNYHVHLLVLEAKTGIDFRELLDNDWGNGFYRIKSIFTEEHRLNAIDYCCKQQIASSSAIMQAIVDTWTASLVITMEDWEEEKKAKLHRLKEEMGLNKINMAKHEPKSFVRDSATGKWI